MQLEDTLQSKVSRKAKDSSASPLNESSESAAEHGVEHHSLPPEVTSEMNMDTEGSPPKVSESMVAERAYDIWMLSGCPDGKEVEHWLQAEEELRSTPH